MTTTPDPQPTKPEPCQCYCHVNPGATCSIDNGSSGVPGKPYCGAHTTDTPTAATECGTCGVQIGSPHVWTDDDCVLDHNDHQPRYVGLICRRHYHWIDSSLSQILELFALLPGAIWPASSGFGGSRPSGEIDAPAPGRVDVMCLTDPRNPGPGRVAQTYERNWNGRGLESNGDDYPDILGILGEWVTQVVEARDPEVTGFLPMSRMVGLLRKHRHWIALQPWVGDYVTEIGDVHQALARGVRESMWPRPIGSCPNCPQKTKLYNTIGVDEVTCRKCKTTWTGIALARLRLIHEQEAG